MPRKKKEVAVEAEVDPRSTDEVKVGVEVLVAIYDIVNGPHRVSDADHAAVSAVRAAFEV